MLVAGRRPADCHHTAVSYIKTRVPFSGGRLKESGGREGKMHLHNNTLTLEFQEVNSKRFISTPEHTHTFKHLEIHRHKPLTLSLY